HPDDSPAQTAAVRLRVLKEAGERRLTARHNRAGGTGATPRRWRRWYRARRTGESNAVPPARSVATRTRSPDLLDAEAPASSGPYVRRPVARRRSLPSPNGDGRFRGYRPLSGRSRPWPRARARALPPDR